MAMGQRALVLSHSNTRRDPRVLRQIKWLKVLDFDEIVTVGKGAAPRDVSRHYEIPEQPFLRRVDAYVIKSGKKEI